ncbi:MAG TPA: hypothetical protein DIW37_15360 [Chryseobacterium sp.]|nr:hypothetical protein [Chryseobacterium sp.]
MISVFIKRIICHSDEGRIYFIIFLISDHSREFLLKMTKKYHHKFYFTKIYVRINGIDLNFTL